MEKAKEVVGTIDRVQELSLHIPGVVADLQIATLLALRERLLVPNFNDVFHLSAVCPCIYKIRANEFPRPTSQLFGSGISTAGSESAFI
jgi:hypothetical protein